MFTFKQEIYDALASEITCSLSNIYYFSGVVEVSEGDMVCRFVASLVIYRRRITTFSEEADTITNVVPVWWECHTTVDGESVENDFDFDKLRLTMIEE